MSETNRKKNNQQKSRIDQKSKEYKQTIKTTNIAQKKAGKNKKNEASNAKNRVNKEIKYKKPPNQTIKMTNTDRKKTTEPKPSTDGIIKDINDMTNIVKECLTKVEKSLTTSENPLRFSEICSEIDGPTIKACEMFRDYETTEDPGVSKAVKNLETAIDDLGKWRKEKTAELADTLKNINRGRKLLKNDENEDIMTANQKKAEDILAEVKKSKLENSDTASGKVLLADEIKSYREKMEKKQKDEKKLYTLARIYSGNGIFSPATLRTAKGIKNRLGFTATGKTLKSKIEEKIQEYEQKQLRKEESEKESGGRSFFG